MLKYDHSNTNTLNLEGFTALSKEMETTMRKNDASFKFGELLTSDKSKQKAKRAEDYKVSKERQAALSKASLSLPANGVFYDPVPSSLQGTVLSVLSHIKMVCCTASPSSRRSSVLAPDESEIDGELSSSLQPLFYTQKDYSTFGLTDLPTLSAALVKFLTSNYAPLVPYGLTQAALTSPIDPASYCLWLRSPALSPDSRFFLLTCLSLFSAILASDTTAYHRNIMTDFYTESGELDKIDQIESNLAKYRGKEATMFEKLARKVRERDTAQAPVFVLRRIRTFGVSLIYFSSLLFLLLSLTLSLSLICPTLLFLSNFSLLFLVCFFYCLFVCLLLKLNLYFSSTASRTRASWKTCR